MLYFQLVPRVSPCELSNDVAAVTNPDKTLVLKFIDLETVLKRKEIETWKFQVFLISWRSLYVIVLSHDKIRFEGPSGPLRPLNENCKF